MMPIMSGTIFLSNPLKNRTVNFREIGKRSNGLVKRGRAECYLKNYNCVGTMKKQLVNLLFSGKKINRSLSKVQKGRLKLDTLLNIISEHFVFFQKSLKVDIVRFVSFHDIILPETLKPERTVNIKR
jgi:hypothetical protein